MPQPPIILSLLRLAKRCGHLLEHRYERLELTRSQARTLTALLERNDLTASDLVAIVGVEPASMTRLLQGLERAGLVERQPHPTDGRAALLSLTDRGREAQREVVQVVEETNAAVTAELTALEIEALSELLDRLARQVDRVDGRHAERCPERREVSLT